MSGPAEETDPGDHTLHVLDRDLAEITALAGEMFDHVVRSIPVCTRALLELDLEAAQQVIESDDRLDHLSIELEDRCFTFIALQQPVAGDLRAAVSAIELNYEIERSGDLVVNIAKAIRRIYGLEFTPRLRETITKMSGEAQKLFSLAGDAYSRGDAGLASALDDMDDYLDDLNEDLIAAVFDAHETEGMDLQAGVQMALIGRYYERIGDHAVNIGEKVQFIVNGWRAEHAGAMRYRARLAEGEAKPETGGAEPDAD